MSLDEFSKLVKVSIPYRNVINRYGMGSENGEFLVSIPYRNVINPNTAKTPSPHQPCFNPL